MSKTQKFTVVDGEATETETVESDPRWFSKENIIKGAILVGAVVAVTAISVAIKNRNNETPELEAPQS